MWFKLQVIQLLFHKENWTTTCNFAYVLQTLWIFSSFAFPLSSPHYNTAYGWFAGPGLSYGLGSTKNEDRLSSFFVKPKQGLCQAPQTTSRPIGLLAEASVTRLLLSTTVVKLERGAPGGTFQWIDAAVHFQNCSNFSIFFTLNICTIFFTPSPSLSTPLDWPVTGKMRNAERAKWGVNLPA